MPINSRQKGARNERAFSAFLKERGIDARRGTQFSGSPDSPDVIADHPGFHVEVKAVEKLNVETAMMQALRDAGDTKLAYVAHKRNGTPWRTTCDAETFIGLLRLVRYLNCTWYRDIHGHIRFEPGVTSDFLTELARNGGDTSAGV